MMTRARRAALVPVLLYLMMACGGGGGGDTSVEMTRTIDVLAAIGTSGISTSVRGFRLGTELDAPLLTEAHWTATTRRLDGAGAESPPCNDGTAYRLTKSGTSGPDDLLIDVRVIGDTGSSDISDDRDCGCDTHVSSLVLNQLRIEPNPPHSDASGLEFGKDVLCPNRLDDLVIGDGQFDGPVEVDLSASLRVVDGGLSLEVTYFARSAP